ncbi:hypothetical protein [Shinella zoogloeoides]|uniref:hypothetical protein n=1 Tax=Shinella zoogloeoides TaxID=352475 RepID=UPI00299F26DF|nr:hypothetical protein [Shinella zoogloeoides]WPE21013.1 hypothetical protein ShzoTeo12_22080 [Shinella zoogloeoides]
MQAGSVLPAAMGPSVRSDLQPENLDARAGGRSREASTGKGQGRSAGPLVYSRSEAGRRPAYFRVLERVFGARRARLRSLLFARAPVLFLMVEEVFLLYVLVGLFRTLLGRRTVGLLLKPGPLAVSPRWGNRWRRAVLQRLKRCRAVRTLSIVPFSVLPPAAAIADGYIYDFQLWDLSEEERKAVNALRAERRPGDRLVLTAIGSQCGRKGFDLFADIYARSARLRACYQFIACGKVAVADAEHAEVLREGGGVTVDRFISDAELLGAYAASDAIWCFYPRTGDQAFGILGRAAQLGLPVVVREGSLGHRLCAIEDVPHLAAKMEGLSARLAGSLPPRDELRGRHAAERFAMESEATLRAALGLAAPHTATEA